MSPPPRTRLLCICLPVRLKVHLVLSVLPRSGTPQLRRDDVLDLEMGAACVTQWEPLVRVHCPMGFHGCLLWLPSRALLRFEIARRCFFPTRLALGLLQSRRELGQDSLGQRFPHHSSIYVSRELGQKKLGKWFSRHCGSGPLRMIEFRVGHQDWSPVVSEFYYAWTRPENILSELLCWNSASWRICRLINNRVRKYQDFNIMISHDSQSVPQWPFGHFDEFRVLRFHNYQSSLSVKLEIYLGKVDMQQKKRTYKSQSVATLTCSNN